MNVITEIAVSHHRIELDPPFPAAWDPIPRQWLTATIVRVADAEGRMGVGSGDTLAGFGEYARLFLGSDPLDLERHERILANIGFHATRPWPVGVALWDLAGQIEGRAVSDIVGGATDRIRPYLSTGALRSNAEMADVAEWAAGEGYPAVKLRFGRDTLEEDVAVLEAVRERVGDRLELLVDCNQGWRMPWDARDPWDFDDAAPVARRLAELGVTWMEEPLHRGDYEGMRRLREETSATIAGGEMTREAHEFQAMLDRDCLDVYQPDVVLTGGFGGLSGLARQVIAQGRSFTPHTWGNGIGLLANLHLISGVGGGPWLEYPLDPPEWTPDRRDFMLAAPIVPDADGWLVCPSGPGLGVQLDEDRLAATEVGREVFR